MLQKIVELHLHDALFTLQGGSNMTGTYAACLHTNQSWSYLNHLVHLCST